MKLPWSPENAPELRAFPPEHRERILRESLETARGGAYSGLRLLGVLVVAVVSLGLTVKFLQWVGYRGGVLALDLGVVVVPFLVAYVVYQLRVLQPYRQSLRRRVREYYAGEAVPVCLKCEYDMSGTRTTACPQCGEPREMGLPLVEEKDEHGNWRL